MDFGELKKINEAIKEYSNIQILTSGRENESDFPATLALFYSLKKLGKNVNLKNDYLPEKYKFLIKKEFFGSSEADFVISVKNADLSRLFYEKSPEGLNLYLKTKGRKVRSEDVKFNSLDSQKLSLAVGINSPPERELKESREVISINNQGKADFGSLNLIVKGSLSLSELIFDLLYSINNKIFDKNISEALLTGILENTNSLTFESLKKISFLTKQEVDFEKISFQLYKFEKEKDYLLLRRILKKIKVSDNNLNWVFLSAKDFQETSSSPKELAFCFKKLSFSNFLCIWGNQGVFYSPNESLTAKASELLAGEKKGKGLLFSLGKSNPVEVKEKISRYV